MSVMSLTRLSELISPFTRGTNCAAPKSKSDRPTRDDCKLFPLHPRLACVRHVCLTSFAISS